MEKLLKNNCVTNLALTESSWVLRLGFKSLMNNISKSKQSNLDWHLFKTEKFLSVS